MQQSRGEKRGIYRQRGFTVIAQRGYAEGEYLYARFPLSLSFVLGQTLKSAGEGLRFRGNYYYTVLLDSAAS